MARSRTTASNLARNTARSALFLATSLALAGCSHRQNSAPMAMVEPTAPDEAMVKRDWPQAEVSYPNGAVAAGPTQFNYEPRRGQAESRYYYADAATFLVNVGLLPYNLIKNPQGGTKIYPGETIGPSYTAQPKLPAAAMREPNTPQVIEGTPNSESMGVPPTTPPVVDPNAPASPMPEATRAPVPTSEGMPSPAPTTPEVIPAPSPVSDVAPEPSLAPATPEATPAAVPVPDATIVSPPETKTQAAPVNEPAPANAPVIESTPLSPATVAPLPAPDPIPAPGEVAPSTPRIIESPPPEAVKNLAPAPVSSPTTGPSLNK